MPGKTGAKKHTHKYFRGHNELWACGWPDCTHYMPGNVQFMMEGRFSICWICESRMILSRANLKQIRPICNECNNKALGVSDSREKLIDDMIRRKIEENARITDLTMEESKEVINKADDDCMTPDICKLGDVSNLCDNCREKLTY